MRRACAWAAFPLLVPACSLGGSAHGHHRPAAWPPVVRAPVRMEAMPRWALAGCATAPEPRSACPATIPAVRRSGASFILTLPTPGNPVSELQLQLGLVYGGFDERAHRPPILSNVVLVGGAFLAQYAAAFPAPGAAPHPIRGAAGSGIRSRAIALGTRTWGGHRGALSPTPSIYVRSGVLADLTIFRWSDAGGDHAVGVNVWAPLAQSVATLHAVVAGLRDRPAPAAPRGAGSVDGIPMTVTPVWMRELCESSPLARPACPARIPAAPLGTAIAGIYPAPAYGSATSVQETIEWFDHSQARNPHPPRFGHVEVSEGRFAGARGDGPFRRISAVRIPKGFFPHAVPIGRPAWTHPHGLLIFGDCFGNHLCYRWSHAGRGYQVDLHAWYPLRQTRDVLRAIVASTPAGRRSQG